MQPSSTSFVARVRRQLLRGARLPVCLGLLATLVVMGLAQTTQPLLRDLLTRLDFVVYDQRFKALPRPLRNDEYSIVIVDYDQRSLEVEGQWPWSRFKLAELVDRLREHGVVVIGFDVFFPEPERNLLQEFAARVTANDDSTGTAASLLPQLLPLQPLLDADAAFAASMRNTDVVLGFSFRANDELHSGVLPAPIFSITPQDSAAIALPRMLGYTGNIATLQDSARGGGFFDIIPDLDGVIRSYNLVLQHEGAIYPSLALEMARLYNVVDRFSVAVESDLQGGKRVLTGIDVGALRIPTDATGRVRVPYTGPSRSFPYISATDVLRGTLSDAQKQLLQNSLVLVGSTATGLYDLRATPVQTVYPGVEIHATVLNGILDSAPLVTVDNGTAQQSTLAAAMAALDETLTSPFPARPDWVSGATLTLLLMVGVALSVLAPRLGPGLMTLTAVTAMAALLLLNLTLWDRYHLDFPLVTSLLLVMAITVINLTYGFLSEGLTRRTIKNMFDQYVPPAHIEAMLHDPDRYDFSGESREMSVLFSDIRNFTTISESLSATALKALLNDFFTPITGVIFEHNGTIDKYVGDMVMAFWGAPLHDPHHRGNAVRAALAMLNKVAELQQQFRTRGLPPIEIGIGINSGLMNVGDMGSTYRRAYTVIGDEVNLGSRLEGLTKNYGVNLLIGENTFDALDGVLCRQIDKVQVKGKDRSVRIYQPLCLLADAPPLLLAQVARWHEAYELYLQQHWDEAEQLLRQLAGHAPDKLLCGMYLERIALLRRQTLSADWDGSWRHTSK